jgi:hypothetical protein
MPTWNTFDLIPAAQFEKANTHFTLNFWLDKTSDPAERFKNAYFSKFKVNPTEYAVMGYDQLIYLGNLLLLNGKNLDKGFGTHEKNELAERFYIDAVHPAQSDSSVIYYENKAVYMMDFF